MAKRYTTPQPRFCVFEAHMARDREMERRREAGLRLVQVEIPEAVAQAVDNVAFDRQEPRDTALNAVLEDWLRSEGYLRLTPTFPS